MDELVLLLCYAFNPQFSEALNSFDDVKSALEAERGAEFSHFLELPKGQGCHKVVTVEELKK